MTTVRRNLEIEEVSFVKQGAGRGVRITMIKNRKDHEMKLDEILKALPEDQRKVVTAELEAKDEALAKAKADATPEPKEPSKEDLLKALPESLQAELKAQADELAAVKKSQAEAIEKAKDAEYLAKAKELSYVPHIKTDVLAKTLRAVDENCSEEVAKSINDHFETVHKTMKASPMFKTLGSGHSDGMGSALDQLQQIAKAYTEKDPNMTPAKAFEAACRNNPGLYKEHALGGKE